MKNYEVEDMAENNVVYLIRWNDAGENNSKDVRVTPVDNGLMMAQSLTSFAGDVIREWKSASVSTEGAGLPELENGVTYHLRILENEQPKKSVSFRITFYDETGTVLGFQEMKKKSCDFKYPEGAAGYSVSAIHNGYKKLFFHHMEICKAEDYITGQLLNPDESKKVVNVVLLDPAKDTLTLPKRDVLSNICNVLVISGTTQPSLELQQAEAKLPSGFASYNKVNFVGSGKKSCDLAVLFSKKYGNGHAYKFEGMIG